MQKLADWICLRFGTSRPSVEAIDKILEEHHVFQATATHFIKIAPARLSLARAISKLMESKTLGQGGK